MKTKSLKSGIIYALTIALAIFCTFFAFSLNTKAEKITYANGGFNAQADVPSENIINPISSISDFSVTISSDAKVGVNQDLILATLGTTSITFPAGTNAKYKIDNGSEIEILNDSLTFDSIGIYTFSFEISGTSYNFILNVLDASNFPSGTNIKLYSYEDTTKTLIYYYDGYSVDYFNKKTSNIFPSVNVQNNYSITFTPANASGNTTPSASNNVLDLNAFGEYRLTWTNNNDNYTTIIYSFGAKNMYSDRKTDVPKDAELSNYNSETNISLTSRTDKTRPEDVDLTKLVHTNQVPVWINYYGSVTQPSIFYRAKGDNATWSQYSSTSRLSQNGYYFISVSGTAPNGLLNNTPFTNYFAFEITSTNPVLEYNSVSTYLTYDGTTKRIKRILSSSDINDSFCNESVTINAASEESTFDKPYSITYSCISDDTSDAEYNFVDKTYNGETLTAKAGHYAKYTITVWFGTQESKVVSTFTVDKTPIEIVPYFGSEEGVNKATDAGYIKSDKEMFGIGSTNSIFYLNNVEKLSGSAVTATVRYYNFVEVNKNFGDPTFTDDNGNTYVKAKYKLNNIPSFEVYNIGQVTSYNSTTGIYNFSNGREMGEGLSAAGLYEFEIMDSAYNTYFYYVYIDNFKPQVIVNETDNEFTITYGEFKVVEVYYEIDENAVAINPHRGSSTTATTDNPATTKSNNITITDGNRTYLKTEINIPDKDYPTSMSPENWKNTQNLRSVDNNNSANNPYGFITNNFVTNDDGSKTYYREVKSNQIIINKNIKSNEGLYNYGVVDVNGNLSNQGQFSISFDLANVKIVANNNGESENAFFGNTFPSLTNGSEVRGTSFDLLEVQSAYKNSTEARNDGKKNIPDFKLSSIIVKFTPKNSNTSENYFGSSTQEYNIYNSDSTNFPITLDTYFKENGKYKEGLYEFVWELTDLDGNPLNLTAYKDAEGNTLYDSTRTQYIVIDRTPLLENSPNAKLTFQGDKNELSINNSELVSNSSKGKADLPSEAVVNSNLTPIRITGIEDYKINKNTILKFNGASEKIVNAIAELFKITQNVTAENGGTTLQKDKGDLNRYNYDDEPDAYSSQGNYSVVISDKLNNGIMFNVASGDANALGAVTAFKFIINRIAPSANFVNDELDKNTEISKDNILGHNIVSANSGVFNITNIEDNVASIQPGKPVYLAFDKTITYDTSDFSNPYTETKYPYNAEIKTDEVEIILNEKTNLKTSEFSKFDDSDRYYINLNALTDELDNTITLKNGDVITIKLKYQGDRNDFYLNVNDIAHLEKTYTIYFDNVAPNYNLEKIKKQDEFYDANKETLENEDDKYFYTIGSGFTFEKATTSSPEYLDTYKIFYRRKNDPITGVSDNNKKTLSTDQANEWKAAHNGEKYPGPIFNENGENFTSIYSAFNYGTMPNFTPNQVYEIVEVDLAGNLTSYFVCLKSDSGLSLTVGAYNYLNNNNLNIATQKRTTLTSNSSSANVYSVNSIENGRYINSFAITSFNSYINNYFIYQIYDVTNNKRIPFDNNYTTASENNLPKGHMKVTSSTAELTTEIVDKLNKYKEGAWHDEGAVFEIRIYDRLSYSWRTITLYNRPLNANNYFSNDNIDALGSIKSDEKTKITITNPAFNSSFEYKSYEITSLSNEFPDPTGMTSTSEGINTIEIDPSNSQNYRLTTIDNYGFVQNKYFSSVGDFARFVNNKNVRVDFAYNTNNSEENNNIVKSVITGRGENEQIVTSTGEFTDVKNLLDKLNTYINNYNLTEEDNYKKLNNINNISFYTDNLTYQYNTAYKDVNKVKIEVCVDPFATNLEFTEIDVQDLTRTDGTINLPNVTDDAFYIYKITIGYKNELEDNSVETVFGAYYNILPKLEVTDSYNNPLYFSQNKIRTTYADVVITSNTDTQGFDTSLNSQVYMTEVNTDENDNKTTIPERPISNQISLRIFGTNYKTREFTFRVVNELGTEQTFIITIDSTSYPIYQVVKRSTSSEEVLAMSSRKFSAIIKNREIPGNQYFTNDADNTEIRLAVDKPLEYEIVQGIDLKTKTVIDETGAEITDTNDSKYNTYSTYTIYRIFSTNPKMFSHEEYVKITYTDKLNINTNNTLANLFQDSANPSSSITSTAQTLTLTYNNNGVYQGSRYIGLDYYANIYINGKLVTTNRNGSIELSDAGFYTIVYRDIAGNTHTFNLNNQMGTQTINQTVNLINKILVDVESDNYNSEVVENYTGELIDNMALENTVRFSVANVNIYGSSLSINAKYNGETINFGAYETLTNGGVYQITLSAVVNNTTITSEYTIYLVKPEEQRLGLEFIANNLNNTTSQVTNVLRRDASNPASVNTDVTNIFRINEGIINNPDAMLLRLRMSPYESGNGLYTVNVSTTYKTIYKPQIDYTFRVMIANSSPLINSNVEFGKEVTKKIVLSWTPSDIYANYGEVNIKIGDTVYSVTANDRWNDQTTSVTISNKGTYNIDISTPSGMILTRYTVIKDDPINTIGIILIVIGSIVLVTGVLLFFLLRNKMRVK